MSVHTEGAINRLTAATLALAVSVESQGEMVGEQEARRRVRARYAAMLEDPVMESPDGDD